MTFRLLLLSFWWTLFIPLQTQGNETGDRVTATTDLRADSRLAAAKRLPLLLMVSQKDCVYCVLLKREIIRPMVISGEYVNKVVIREMFMDAGVRVKDFDGKETKAKDLAHRYKVFLTPTLLLLDADGRELTRRIVGVNSLDMYGVYLDEAIEDALDRLRARAGSDGQEHH